MTLPDPLTDHHRYIPNSADDITEMLAATGVDSVDRLFDSIPEDVKLDRLLDLPGPWSEIESRRWFRAAAARNKTAVDHLSFLGGGAYAHSQPAVVDQLLLRAEFLTSYTPYQPEVSQGTLQSIFEYQMHQCMLTGLDVANASLYDGSTALCEAVLLAERVVKNRRKVVIARSVHPHYTETVHTYIQNLGYEVIEVGWTNDGRVDTNALREACTSDVFGVAANIYLSLMGKEGLRELGLQCLQKASYLRKRLNAIASVALPFSGPAYNEFVVRTPIPADEILGDLEHEKILGGIPLAQFFPEHPNDFLVAVTELHTREQLDHFTDALSAAIARERR